MSRVDRFLLRRVIEDTKKNAASLRVALIATATVSAIVVLLFIIR